VRAEDFAPNAPGRLVKTLEGHLAFVPDPLPPRIELTLPTIRLLGEAERALGELKGLGRRLPNPHLLINPFQRREALLSSRIEGTTAGMQQLLLFEADPASAPRDSDVHEVANYVTALTYTG
jgi:Fic family protein